MSQRHILIPAVVVGLASLAGAQIAFQPQIPYATQGVRPDSVAVGDFDGQNGIDFAITSGSAQGGNGPDFVQFFRNLGNGTFVSQQAVNLGNNVEAAAVIAADLDGDADLDLAVSLKNTNAVRIVINTGGVFALGGITSITGVEPYAMSAADLDGDGDVDLVTSNRTSNNLSVLTNDGSGAFTLTGTLAVGLEPRFVALDDLNGDCRTDIAVAAHDSRRIDVLFNLGAGTFGGVTSFAVLGNEKPAGLVAADLDADGDVDLATTSDNNDQGIVVVLRNNGAGSFTSTSHPTLGANPDAIVAGDFDADGDKDLATSDEDTSIVSVLPNTGAANFGAPTVLAVGLHPSGLARADFDGNGSLDLVTANRDSNNASVLINATNGGTDNFCVTTPNSVGFGTRIDSTGSPSVSAGSLQLLARCAPAGTPGLFFQGDGQANTPFFSGRLCLTGQLIRLPVVFTDATGHAVSPVNALANGVAPGSTRYYQFWHRDVGATADLSDGLRATFIP